jgi:succinate dehydrogenase hydrophobic anchor subunit
MANLWILHKSRQQSVPFVLDCVAGVVLVVLVDIIIIIIFTMGF